MVLTTCCGFNLMCSVDFGEVGGSDCNNDERALVFTT